MSIVVQKPSSLLTSIAFDMYNKTKSSELPAANGHFGIDKNVREALLQLTYDKMGEMGIPLPGVNIHTGKRMMNGLCIYASVVATKFFVMRNRLLDSRLVRVQKGGDDKGADHYFVVANDGTQKIICDITCEQFAGAPDYLVGRLADVKGTAKKVIITGGSLYDAYAAGAATTAYVL